MTTTTWQALSDALAQGIVSAREVAQRLGIAQEQAEETPPPVVPAGAAVYPAASAAGANNVQAVYANGQAAPVAFYFDGIPVTPNADGSFTITFSNATTATTANAYNYYYGGGTPAAASATTYNWLPYAPTIDWGALRHMSPAEREEQDRRVAEERELRQRVRAMTDTELQNERYGQRVDDTAYRRLLDVEINSRRDVATRQRQAARDAAYTESMAAAQAADRAATAAFLTEAEQRSLDEHHFMRVHSQHFNGRIYRIPDRSGGMVEIYEGGHARRSLCLQPAGTEGYLSDRQWVALQKLMLLSDEARYLYRAVHWGDGGRSQEGKQRDINRLRERGLLRFDASGELLGPDEQEG